MGTNGRRETRRRQKQSRKRLKAISCCIIHTEKMIVRWHFCQTRAHFSFLSVKNQLALATNTRNIAIVSPTSWDQHHVQESYDWPTLRAVYHSSIQWGVWCCMTQLHTDLLRSKMIQQQGSNKRSVLSSHKIPGMPLKRNATHYA